LGRYRQIHGAARIFDHEQREEALIMRAAGDGIELLRRPDASPLAVLGLAGAAKEQAAQVA
jgi:hypothetical protein